MLQSVLHTAINVSNLTAAEHFYGEILGLTKVDRTLKFAGAWYQLGSFQIHLIVAERDYAQPESDEKWGRLTHLAFAIADLEAAKQKLTVANVPMQASSSGRAAIFIQDPDGHVIELSQL
ncbi:glyoxalase bleomycin resistance protein dioxygenase [Leptolyngbya sp. Heron Island J]|uniref:VOC family protein n=1 Tax=Leptolyngbya sp. Heron Island J TaxID=1385935 RepID=UPI0003B96846|nr:VOC family protein [Leptolyngbya sp. Heron Island J]ESA34822.1 glyoxalase bleomycin resistance protein dioxygenase [Leptolyngbya sp. Heron Island J]